MNPGKLHQFVNNQLLPDEAKKYACTVIEEEMPRGLKQYIELELFPRIHFSIKKSISLSAVRGLMLTEGFAYSSISEERRVGKECW